MSQALSVAKEFVKLSLAGAEPDPLTNLRLQKLLYYAQAWSLVVRQSELFPDDVQAWRHGQQVNHLAPDSFADASDLHAEEVEFVRCVWEAYQECSAEQTMPAPLAAYSHKLRRQEEEAALALAEMPALDAELLAAAATSFSPSVKRP